MMVKNKEFTMAFKTIFWGPQSPILVPPDVYGNTVHITVFIRYYVIELLLFGFGISSLSKLLTYNLTSLQIIQLNTF